MVAAGARRLCALSSRRSSTGRLVCRHARRLRPTLLLVGEAARRAVRHWTAAHVLAVRNRRVRRRFPPVRHRVRRSSDAALGDVAAPCRSTAWGETRSGAARRGSLEAHVASTWDAGGRPNCWNGSVSGWMMVPKARNGSRRIRPRLAEPGATVVGLLPPMDLPRHRATRTCLKQVRHDPSVPRSPALSAPRVAPTIAPQPAHTRCRRAGNYGIAR